VASQARQPAFQCPTAVAIHDDGNVLGHSMGGRFVAGSTHGTWRL